LHVYTNLVQVPTLVLEGSLNQIKTLIAEKRFSISIDSGPWFQVTHARLEGNDPIALSILLDNSATDLMPKISDAIAALAPSMPSDRDSISVYAMGCGLTRSLNNVPPESAELRLGVDAALRPGIIRQRDRNVPNCGRPVHLWDALGFIISELHKLPGRRVILVVTDGHDRGSVRSWNEVRRYAQVTGVAVFGIMEKPVVASTVQAPAVRQRDENALQSICELSGGMVMMTNFASVQGTLERSIAMLRARYILEFPRPAKSTSGEHDMRIKIAGGDDDFIMPTGITVPLPDPASSADPMTVRSDPSHTPEQGQRRILKNSK
jgi:hypothetical protein